MKIYNNFEMSKISWFRCGGFADVFAVVDNIIELQQVVKDFGEPKLVVGNGSNLLVRDGGIRGLVVKLSGDFLKCECLENNEGINILAGSGCLSKKIAKVAKDNGCIGLEFMDSIPGTTGGMIKTNAGCFGKEIKDVLKTATLLINGEIVELKNQDFNFSYRHGKIPKGAMVLSAKFATKKGNEEEIIASHDLMNKIAEHRKEHQIVGATCGSTFANPESQSVWKLIDGVGLRGKLFGGAKFSEKHCNFIINTGKATATDIENLINEAKRLVFEKYGIELKTEIQIVGEK